ncbi:cytochrome C, partial [Pseudomonas aeruginosa]|nr:cytochrome C [Pseudomonas aeruginosa]
MKPLLTALLLVLLGAPAAFAAGLGDPLDAPAPDGRRPRGPPRAPRPPPPRGGAGKKGPETPPHKPPPPPPHPPPQLGG